MKIRKNLEINEEIDTETPLNSCVRYKDVLLQKVIGNCDTCYFHLNGIICTEFIDKFCYRCTTLEPEIDYCFIKV